MKKRFLIIAVLFFLVFASISSISALATTGEPIEQEEFTNVEEEDSQVVEPRYLPAYYAIANAARVVNSVGKAVKWGAAAYSGGFLAAAGADHYSKVSGAALYNAEVPANAELAFD